MNEPTTTSGAFHVNACVLYRGRGYRIVSEGGAPGNFNLIPLNPGPGVEMQRDVFIGDLEPLVDAPQPAPSAVAGEDFDTEKFATDEDIETWCATKPDAYRAGYRTGLRHAAGGGYVCPACGRGESASPSSPSQPASQSGVLSDAVSSGQEGDHPLYESFADEVLDMLWRHYGNENKGYKAALAWSRKLRAHFATPPPTASDSAEVVERVARAIALASCWEWDNPIAGVDVRKNTTVEQIRDCYRHKARAALAAARKALPSEADGEAECEHCVGGIVPMSDTQLCKHCHPVIHTLPKSRS